MRICVYGAGSVGGLIGGALARQGHDVALIARGAHLEALKAAGCTVETGGERFTVHPLCTDDPGEAGVQDYVVIAVKEPALRGVAERVAPLLDADTVVATAMNGLPWWFFDGFPEGGPEISLSGLDPDGTISSAIPIDRLIACVVHVGADVPEPGVIRHLADRRLIFGAAGGVPADRAAKLADAFVPTPIDATVTPRARQEIWLKLLGNFNFAPISALTGATTRAIGTDPALRRLCVDMFEEAAAAGRAVGLESGMTAEERTDLGVSLGEFRTSMLQDFEKGRPPEIKSIVASVVEFGRAVGVSMPVSEAVLALVSRKAKEMGIG